MTGGGILSIKLLATKVAARRSEASLTSTGRTSSVASLLSSSYIFSLFFSSNPAHRHVVPTLQRESMMQEPSRIMLAGLSQERLFSAMRIVSRLKRTLGLSRQSDEQKQERKDKTGR